MAEYEFVNKKGEIVAEDYRQNTYLSSDRIKEILKNSLQLFYPNVSIDNVDSMSDVYHVTSNDASMVQDIYFCCKGVTPGGRKGLKDEQRIQPKAKFLNFVYDKECKDDIGIFLGIYAKEDAIVFCAWKASPSEAKEDTPISKQIKISCIATALKEGFAQYSKGNNEYACAFKPEFLCFYIRNRKWLHSGFMEDVTENTESNVNKTDDSRLEIRYHTGLKSDKPLNRILFGAPGTGKSYMLKNEAKELLGEDVEDGYERVTFHPDYSYANFVGTYKPVPFIDDDGKDSITYSYVPGPFMRVYINALKNSRTDDIRPFLLIIEEINRANVAAVFGDIFQLLDRDDDGVSDYPIQASEDIKKYLADELGGQPSNYNKILIPNNMFIWATMNSADQGVFPMDTAFKRRWDFTYIGINASEEGIQGKEVLLGKGNNQRKVEWNVLRKSINNKLSSLKINEDKLLGPYFLSKKIVPQENDIDEETFIAAFKNKVLMYLFDDAAKQKRSAIFADGVDTTKYSAICDAFDEKGVFIFCKEISDQFIKKDESS